MDLSQHKADYAKISAEIKAFETSKRHLRNNKGIAVMAAPYVPSEWGCAIVSHQWSVICRFVDNELPFAASYRMGEEGVGVDRKWATGKLTCITEKDAVKLAKMLVEQAKDAPSKVIVEIWETDLLTKAQDLINRRHKIMHEGFKLMGISF